MDVTLEAADVAPRPALRPQLLQQRCKAEMPSFAAPLRRGVEGRSKGSKMGSFSGACEVDLFVEVPEQGTQPRLGVKLFLDPPAE